MMLAVKLGWAGAVEINFSDDRVAFVLAERGGVVVVQVGGWCGLDRRMVGAVSNLTV